MSTALAEMPRPQRRAPAPRPVHVATTRNLTKSYGAIVALRDLNLEVRSGELLALLGPNGAGKTTLVRMLLGVARPDAGSVSVFGADPHGGRVQPRLGAMLQVGRVPETLRGANTSTCSRPTIPPHCRCRRPFRSRASRTSRIVPSASFQAARSSGCCSALRSAEILICSFLMSRR